ncbi:MAG TPA: hypothetical protein V6C97_12580 [Oculatellaceae cyanobacterium]
MSYLVLSLILSGLVGFIGMFVLMASLPTERDHPVIWMSGVFWGAIALLSWLTVGWPSALVAIGAAVVCAGLCGRAGNVSFAWGRALRGIGNADAVRTVPVVSWPLIRVGHWLESIQPVTNTLFAGRR